MKPEYWYLKDFKYIQQTSTAMVSMNIAIKAIFSVGSSAIHSCDISAVCQTRWKDTRIADLPNVLRHEKKWALLIK